MAKPILAALRDVALAAVGAIAGLVLSFAIATQIHFGGGGKLAALGFIFIGTVVGACFGLRISEKTKPAKKSTHQ